MSLNRTVLARRVNQRSSKAAKLNAFERKRLQEMRKAQKIQNQIARLLKSMVIRVEKRIDREVKSEKKKAKKLQKELLRQSRLNEASKKRKLKIRKNTLRRCIREELIFRKRCIQQLRAPRQDETKSKCTCMRKDSHSHHITHSLTHSLTENRSYYRCVATQRSGWKFIASTAHDKRR